MTLLFEAVHNLEGRIFAQHPEHLSLRTLGHVKDQGTSRVHGRGVVLDDAGPHAEGSPGELFGLEAKGSLILRGGEFVRAVAMKAHRDGAVALVRKGHRVRTHHLRPRDVTHRQQPVGHRRDGELRPQPVHGVDEAPRHRRREALSGDRFAFGPRTFALQGPESYLAVDERRDLGDLGRCSHLFNQNSLVATLERPVKANPGHRFAIRGKAQKEEGHPRAVFEVATPKRLFEAVTAVHAFGAVQVNLPQIGPFERVVTFETNAGRLVDETRPVSVATTHDVSHKRPSRRDEFEVTSDQKIRRLG